MSLYIRRYSLSQRNRQSNLHKRYTISKFIINFESTILIKFIKLLNWKVNRHCDWKYTCKKPLVNRTIINRLYNCEKVWENSVSLLYATKGPYIDILQHACLKCLNLPGTCIYTCNQVQFKNQDVKFFVICIQNIAMQ